MGPGHSSSDDDDDIVNPPNAEDIDCNWEELMIFLKHKSWSLKKEMLLGRHRSCDIVIDDCHVSRKHARIRNGIIKDNSTRNGTFINRPDNRIKKEYRLKVGDTIFLGKDAIQLEVRKRSDQCAIYNSPPQSKINSKRNHNNVTVRKRKKRKRDPEQKNLRVGKGKTCRSSRLQENGNVIGTLEMKSDSNLDSKEPNQSENDSPKDYKEYKDHSDHNQHYELPVIPEPSPFDPIEDSKIQVKTERTSEEHQETKHKRKRKGSPNYQSKKLKHSKENSKKRSKTSKGSRMKNIVRYFESADKQTSKNRGDDGETSSSRKRKEDCQSSDIEIIDLTIEQPYNSKPNVPIDNPFIDLTKTQTEDQKPPPLKEHKELHPWWWDFNPQGSEQASDRLQPASRATTKALEIHFNSIDDNSKSLLNSKRSGHIFDSTPMAALFALQTLVKHRGFVFPASSLAGFLRTFFLRMLAGPVSLSHMISSGLFQIAGISWLKKNTIVTRRKGGRKVAKEEDKILKVFEHVIQDALGRLENAEEVGEAAKKRVIEQRNCALITVICTIRVCLKQFGRDGKDFLRKVLPTDLDRILDERFQTPLPSCTLILRARIRSICEMMRNESLCMT